MGTRDRVLLSLLLIGFVTFLLEVRYEHRYVVQEMWQGWVPIIYSGLATIACLLGMSKSKTARTVAASIFFLGFAVSGFGLYMHTKFEPAKFEKFLFPNRTVTAIEDGARVEVQIPRPIAAPLGIMGLASIAFIITSGLFRTGKGS